MLDKGQKQSSTLSCDSSYVYLILMCLSIFHSHVGTEQILLSTGIRECEGVLLKDIT